MQTSIIRGRVRDLKIPAHLIVSRLEFREIFLKDTNSYWQEELERSVALTYSEMPPPIHCVELPDGDLTVISGCKYITALSDFLSSKVAYPKDGALESFQGNLFSQISEPDARILVNCELSLKCLKVSDLNDPLIKEFEGLTHHCHLLSR